MKKFALMFLPILILAGCGGGGKGPISPPTPPPPSPPPGSQPSVNLSANPTHVKSSDVVNLTLTAQPTPTHVDWRQSPSNPTGNFRVVSTYRAQWIAPAVTSETQFTLTALVYFANHNPVEASVSVTVLPGGSPGNGSGGNVVTPKVYISYPNGNFNDNVVADGIKLQVFGRCEAGSYPVSRLDVIIDGRVVAQLYNPASTFQLDVEEFGTPGAKQLVVRAVDSQGNTGEATVQIEHDPAKLEQLAREFLKRYCSFYDDNNRVYRLYRYGDLQDGPYAKPVRIYIWPEVQPYRRLVEEACRFWTRYTGIEFEVIDWKDEMYGKVPLPHCILRGKFDEDPYPIIAEAKRWYDPQGKPGKIAGGSITLYKGWLRLSDELKSLAIAHEFAHILVIPDSDQGHTDNNSFMDWNLGKRYFHPYMQRAVRILYSKNPGDQI